MKKLVCLLLLLCLCLSATAESMGGYVPVYGSPAATRAGETVSMSTPLEQVAYLAPQLQQLGSFSIGAGRTFVYVQQGMLIVEFTSQAAQERCVVSCRTQDEMGNPVLEILLEQFAADNKRTLGVVYAYMGGVWQPRMMQ